MKTRILVVEDEILLRALADEEFAEAGFDVETAATGDLAAQMLRAGDQFDVLFTDIRMPGQIDGWQLGRIAAQIAPGIRIIYVTGYSEQIRQLGPNERFMPKPYRFSDAVQAIETMASTPPSSG